MLGRFAQADTMIPGAGDPQAWDRYAYVKNNPLRYNDPTGHYEQEEGDIDGSFCSTNITAEQCQGKIYREWVEAHQQGYVDDYTGFEPDLVGLFACLIGCTALGAAGGEVILVVCH